MLTRTADSALPSLYEACHEEPYKAQGVGFASWPATKWHWFGELAARPTAHPLKVHRGKSIQFSDESLALVDPICRAELARMEEADAGWRRLLGHVAEAGPSTLEDIQIELHLGPKELKALRYPLERCGAVVSRSVVKTGAGDGHLHTSELARFDQVYPQPAGGGSGIAELVVAAARAAVVAPEGDVRRWFSWSWLVSPELVEDLVGEGLLYHPAPGWIAASEVASG